MIRFLILALLLALPASADDLRHELERHGLTPEQLSEAGRPAFTSDCVSSSSTCRVRWRFL